MFGYHYAVKGVDLAINAVKKLALDGKNVVLQIVVAKNDALIKKTIIENFNVVPDFVELLPPRNDIATYYKNSDVFLSASREESFCYAIREAAYCECLVIASDIPAHNDVPLEFRFKSQDYLDLYEKISFAINLENRQEIVQNSKEFVIKKYSIDSWSQQISTIFKSLKN
jgi:glycosyltransferase involved in cell wall biosynthesis